MIRYKGRTDLKNKLLKDMVLVCFNVSVYLMDTTTKKLEGSNSNETITSSINEKSCNSMDCVERKDTSLFEEISMVNPTNTYELNEDTKMMESSVDEKIIENYTIDLVSPSTKVFPDVLFDSESKKEKRSKSASLNERQEIDENFPSTSGLPDVLFDSESTKENQAKLSAGTKPTTSVNDVNKDMFSVQDAFAFCPTGDTIVLNEVLQQGIFASEQEMDQLEETKDSILTRLLLFPLARRTQAEA